MEEKTQKILLGAIIILLVVIIGLVIWQQKTITSLKKMIFNPSGSETAAGDMEEVRQPADLVELTRESLIKNTKEIRGKVLGVKGNSINMEADVVELERLPFAESLDLEKLPRTKKNISVKTNDKTEFLSAKLEDIKPDVQIQVFTNDLVYMADQILATRVNYPYISGMVSGQRFVSGKIKEIKGNVFVVSALSKEGKETGTYDVNITNDTKFIKKELAEKETAYNMDDLKTGDNVLARASDPIGDRKQFDAVAIEYFPPTSVPAPKNE
jgi:hypothetical protein